MNLNLFFTPTDILLPAHADMRRWSVIACDQFTADAGYWQAVQDTVCDAPSTLRLMLPEFYLGKCDEAAATREIQQTMRRYLDDGVFRTVQTRMGAYCDEGFRDFHNGCHPYRILLSPLEQSDRISVRCRSKCCSNTLSMKFPTVKRRLPATPTRVVILRCSRRSI